jgi:hypothetical protein
MFSQLVGIGLGLAITKIDILTKSTIPEKNDIKIICANFIVLRKNNDYMIKQTEILSSFTSTN